MFQRHERYFRMIGIPALGIFLSFVFCPDIPSLAMMIKVTSFVFVFWQGICTIINYFRRKYPKVRQTTKRLLFTLLVASAYLIIADFFLRIFFQWLFPDLEWTINSYAVHTGKNFFISFLVASIYEMAFFHHQWSQSTLETEQLKTQQIISHLESLKNQISPHFLFNSLNTLAAIIPENQDQAVRFTEKLSEVYRYILQYKDKELVHLKTELEFIHSYLFLLKIRYPENLQFVFQIDEAALKGHVAPLTLQILVENAIKHNVISKSEPLTIEIYTDEEGNVVVRNKLQLKSIARNSTKTGLDNIRKRYQYLSNRSIEIVQKNQQFLVSVPLISLGTEKVRLS